MILDPILAAKLDAYLAYIDSKIAEAESANQVEVLAILRNYALGAAELVSYLHTTQEVLDKLTEYLQYIDAKIVNTTDEDELEYLVFLRYSTLKAAELVVEGGGGGGGNGDFTWSDVQTAVNTRQPLDSDLTAIAALTTTSFGRGLLTSTNAEGLRTTLNLGSAALSNTSEFAEAGHTHNIATTLDNGFLSASDKTKLDGISVGATANATNAQLRDRTTHTGTQDISTITGLQTALDGKQAVDSDLTAIAALTGTGYARRTGSGWELDDNVGQVDNVFWGDILGTLSNQTDLNTALNSKANSVHTHTTDDITGLGSAAFQNTSSFATSSQGTLANTALQPSAIGTTVQAYNAKLDSISALNTNSFGLNLLTLTNAAGLRSAASLGTAALSNIEDFASTSHIHPLASASENGFLSSAGFTKLAGIATGATANSTDAQLRDRSTHTGTQSHTTITGLGTAALAASTDFATAAEGDLAVTALQPSDIGVTVQAYSADLIELAALETTSFGLSFLTQTNAASTRTTLGLGSAAVANSTDFAEALHSHSNASGTTSGFMSSADFSKLQGIQSGATANATDAQLRDRTTHTGLQPHTSITGLGTAATANTVDFAASVHTHDLASGDINGFMSSADFSKLAGIQSGATANNTNAFLLSRANHTGTQPHTTITGLGTAATANIGDFATAAQGILAGTALQPDAIGSTVQGYDADLAAIAAISGTSTGYLRKSGENTWVLDTPSGGVTGLQPADIGVTVQGYDPDLSAIAALTTTSYGRGLLTSADAAALRTTAGLGTAALSSTGDFATAAQGTLAGTALQPGAIGTTVQGYDADLAAIAALTTTTFGRDLLTSADATALRTTAGLGTAALANTGDFATASHTHELATGSVDGFLSAAGFTKLAGIQTGATANSTDSFLLNRANHTGTQPHTSVTGLGTAATSNIGDFATAVQGALAATALQPSAIGSTIQAFDADLQAIGALSDASTGYLRKTGANTWTIDTPAGGSSIGDLTQETNVNPFDDFFAFRDTSANADRRYTWLRHPLMRPLDYLIVSRTWYSSFSVANGVLDEYLAVISNGTAAATSTNTATGQPQGYVRLSTGSTASGRTSISTVLGSDDLPRIKFETGKRWYFSALVYLSNLGDATNSFTVKVGFDFNNNGTTSANALYFRYNPVENSGFWVLRPSANSVGSGINTGIAPTTTEATAQLMEMLYTPGTGVQAWINGVSISVPNTDLPIGPTQGVAFQVGIYKGAGTTERSLFNKSIILVGEL